MCRSRHGAPDRVHVATGWLLAALVALHVLAALLHAVARVGMFARMWPWGARAATATTLPASLA